MVTSNEVPLDPALIELANGYGVSTQYVDQTGRTRAVSEESLKAVLASMDVDASTAANCRAQVKRLAEDRWRRVIPPTLVFRQVKSDPDPWQTWVRTPRGASVRLWLELEDGSRRFDVTALIAEDRGRLGRVDGQVFEEVSYRIPNDIPLGWHELIADVDGRQARCTLVVTPERITNAVTASTRQRWGVAAQLYSVRSHRSWGIGDLADLADLTAWFGRDHGADFILVNPLHASYPCEPMEPSPYLPATRRFSNPAYIRVEEIAEFEYLAGPDMAVVLGLAAKVRAELNETSRIDRDAAWRYKDLALRKVCEVVRTPGRQALFEKFCAEQGAGLRQFACWCAIASHFGPHWNQWPLALQDCNSAEVATFAADHAAEIDYYVWLQWILDEQMALSQTVSTEVGMTIGVMHDLAVGVHQFAADTWLEPNVCARGVTVGAPPDTFNQVGQNWSQPPRRPDQLAATGYASYRDMLRTLLRHSGGLRIDHILGLFRLWWIPTGSTPADGAYVRYDHHAMVNILVLEAQRAGAVIVGEDLGTVESWVQDFLAERGILGTTIAWFERAKGVPTNPQQWRPDAMTSVTVHDLPPTLGYLAGDHVELRNDLGLLTVPVADERLAHDLEIQAWRTALERSKLLRPNASDVDIMLALHRYITWSPSKLLSVALPDLVGQRETQNQPGTIDEYPNWRVPLADGHGKLVFLEDLPHIELLKRLVSAVGGRASHS